MSVYAMMYLIGIGLLVLGFVCAKKAEKDDKAKG